MNRGTWNAVGAYALWGLLPVYWKCLQHVPAPQVLCHRIIWSFLTLLVLILILRRWNAFRTAVVGPRVLRAYAAAAVLIGISAMECAAIIDACRALALVEQPRAQEADQLLLAAVRMLSKMCRH